MTPQEIKYAGNNVVITGIISKNSKAHLYVIPYVGKCGIVVGDAKNNMLLVKFLTIKRSKLICHFRAIPAGCVNLFSSLKFAE
jgi:hypothetical protein